MSTYIAKTKHPITGRNVDAVWVDDYFGSHHYGVQFLGETYFFDPEIIKMPIETENTTDHTFTDFKFFQEDEDIEEPLEQLVDDIEMDNYLDVVSSKYMLVEIGNSDEDYVEFFKTRLAMDFEIKNFANKKSLIAYAFETNIWFIPVLTIEDKKLK